MVGRAHVIKSKCGRHEARVTRQFREHPFDDPGHVHETEPVGDEAVERGFLGGIEHRTRHAAGLHHLARKAQGRIAGILRRAELKLADPGGNPTEIFFGPQVDTHKPFHPGRPMFGKFLTGSQGIGHCILRQDDVEAAAQFYELLGLRGSVEYHLHLPNGMVAQPYFMHCNERQHSIAFGLGPMEKRINHLMFEYTNLDDLGMAHDIVREKKIDVALQLGKHANDQALTFYCANPSGWLWEFGWGARQAPSQQEYYTRDIFGHGNEAAGYGMDIPLL